MFTKIQLMVLFSLICLFLILIAVKIIHYLSKLHLAVGIVYFCLQLLVMNLLLLGQFGIGAFLMVFLVIFQLMNALRLLHGRLQTGYLIQSFCRTGLTILVVQTAILLSSVIVSANSVQFWLVFFIVSATTSLIACLVILVNLINNVIKASVRKVDAHPKDLPTVSVLIPARNEDEQLRDCLNAVTSSDYPKLEIIALDDCSQGNRTNEIIKSFAQSGVRFIQGDEPDVSWLAKNQAYQKLYEASSGEYLIFMGSDIDIGYDFVSDAVKYINKNQLKMVSFLPHNHRISSKVALVGPLRYFLEIAMPHWLSGRPPVLSSCWIIQRKALENFGGFKSVNRQVIPEIGLSRHLNQQKSYAFIIAGQDFAVSTDKSFDEQISTTKRVSYPLLHRKIEVLALITFVYISFFLGPVIYLIVGVIDKNWYLTIVSFLAIILILSADYIMNFVAGIRGSSLRLLTWHIRVVLEIIWLFKSMYGYEFGRIDWKGRNICLPVMHLEYRSKTNASSE